MKNIMQSVTYWGQVLLLPLYWLSYLMPRNKRIWLFGSTFGNRFSDNPRYLYLYLSDQAMEKHTHIRPIWISHNQGLVQFLNRQGYEAYYYHSLKGLWFALTGGVYCYDNYSKDINFWQSGGAMKVNLWHGIPLKKIQQDNIHDSFRHPKNRREAFCNFPRNLSDEKPTDYILCPCEPFRDIFSSAFRTKNVLLKPYPRWDAFERKSLCLPMEERYLSRIHSFRQKRPGGKVLCYMPTFRESETKLLSMISIPKIEAFLREQDLLLVVKLHPKSKIKEPLRKMLQGCSKRILPVDAQYDSNIFLAEADVLITDYSSCYFDYLYVNRPIVFFDYDYEDYIAHSRELYFDYEAMTPGAKAGTIQELRAALEELQKGEDSYACQRDTIRKRLGIYKKANKD